MSFIPSALLSDLSKLTTQGPKPVPARKASNRVKTFAPANADPLPDNLSSTITLPKSPPQPSRPTTQGYVQRGSYAPTSSQGGRRGSPPGRSQQPLRQPTDINDELAFVYEAPGGNSPKLGHESDIFPTHSHSQYSRNYSRESQRTQGDVVTVSRAQSINAEGMNIVAPAMSNDVSRKVQYFESNKLLIGHHAR